MSAAGKSENLSSTTTSDDGRRPTRNQKLTCLFPFLPLPIHTHTHTHSQRSALAVDIGNATASTSSWEELVMSSDAQSYSEQYDRLFADLPLDVKKVRGVRIE